jgi:hypothetical protein
MAIPVPTTKQYGLLVPTTYIWDIQSIQSSSLSDADMKELLVRIYQNMNVIALALNARDIGQYQVTEQFNGQQFFSNPLSSTSIGASPPLRQGYRTVVNFGALPNTTTKSVPHNITCTNGTIFTRIYACASDTTDIEYIPIPYSSNTLIDNIEINVDGANVNITTGSNRSNFNICYVVLEYLKY